ncbi:MAG: ATP-binding protein [Deltaproteobacteria bacterium]|nr:ATP-binding protein [Deltaproteobacteria bacterium]
MARLQLPYVQAFSEHFPVVSLIGPRGVGKEALSFEAFPNSHFVDLDAPDQRERMRRSPRRFLAELPRSVVIGAAHRVPELLPALGDLLALAEERDRRFLLAGTRPLVGEPAELQGLHSRLWLLPYSITERITAGSTLDEVMWTGGFPGLLEGRLPAKVWFSDYVGTFLDRELRDLVDVTDAETFLSFLRAVAGQSGDMLNLSALAREVGVAHGTAKSWLAALEAALFVLPAPAFKHPEWKRLVTAPRLHLLDTGLLCWLLGIESPAALAGHPRRGRIFQTFVWSELLKSRLLRGASPGLSHFRDRKGNGVDVVFMDRDGVTGMQVALVPRAGGGGLRTLARLSKRLEGEGAPAPRQLLIHAGDQALDYRGVQLVPWRELGSLIV